MSEILKCIIDDKVIKTITNAAMLSVVYGDVDGERHVLSGSTLVKQNVIALIKAAEEYKRNSTLCNTQINLLFDSVESLMTYTYNFCNRNK